MHSGGFDVVVGNPPYVEYHKTKDLYRIGRHFRTATTGNLYAYVIERTHDVCHNSSRTGMIVQLSAICTDRMKPLQELYRNDSTELWTASFDDRPGKLFDGLEHIRAVVVINHVGHGPAKVYTTALRRWYTQFRPCLFATCEYCEATSLAVSGSLPKIGTNTMFLLLKKMQETSDTTIEEFYNPRGPAVLHYYRSPLYWIRAMDFAPYFSSQTEQRSVHHLKDFTVSEPEVAQIVGSTINSSLFYIWFIVFGNGRNIAFRDILTFPVPTQIATDFQNPRQLFSALMEDYRRHSIVKTRRDGVEYQEFYPARSKWKLDEIDLELARLYGLSLDETDFIINYDIKYRMGIEGSRRDNKE